MLRSSRRVEVVLAGGLLRVPGKAWGCLASSAWWRVGGAHKSK